MIKKEKTGNTIIAVDFDGTLCTDCYPLIGQQNLSLFTYLKRRKKEGARLILWTCRCGLELEHAIIWCRHHGLEFDAVNANLPEVIIQYGGDSRKIYADIYIDDRSVNLSCETCRVSKTG